MPACELLSTCPYFNDSMYEMAKTDKEWYCRGDYGWCGKYMAFKALERELRGRGKELWKSNGVK